MPQPSPSSIPSFRQGHEAQSTCADPTRDIFGDLGLRQRTKTDSARRINTSSVPEHVLTKMAYAGDTGVGARTSRRVALHSPSRNRPFAIMAGLHRCQGPPAALCAA